MPASPLGQLVQLIGCPCLIVDGRGRHVGADQQRGCTERGHQPELVLGTAEVAFKQVVGYCLVVAEWLVEQDAQAQVRGAPPHLSR